MRYLRVALLLLAIAVGTQACFIVADGPGRGWHHHHHDWR
jgi:hypothetical protein